MTADDPAIRWQLPPELAAVLLDSAGRLRLNEWLAHGEGQIIKDAAHRCIYRIKVSRERQRPELYEGAAKPTSLAADAPGLSTPLDFYLKQYRASGLRNRLRETLRSTKAKSEYDKAAALVVRGVAVPRPLGWGVLGSTIAPRASFLLSETVADAPHLTEVLQDLDAARRNQISKALGRYLAKLHAAGVTHHDLHPGNLLVRWALDAEPEFVLIDLHEVHLGRPLSWRRRRENLCVFNRYFMLRATRTDRLRFWRAYAAAADDAIPDHPIATPDKLEEASALSNLRFWIAREKKYLAASRLVRTAAYGLAAASIPPEKMSQISEGPHLWFDPTRFRQLKTGGASTVVATPFGVFKRFNVRSSLDRVKNRFRRSPALRSWVFGHALLDAALPTPKPLALLRGDSGEEYLLTEEILDTVDLREFVDHSHDMPIREWRERLRTVARSIRQLHDRHFGHRDLKAGNLLTPSDFVDHRVWFIDLVGLYRRRRVSRKARVRDLARLLASFFKHPGLTHGDRLRFLLGYFGAACHGKAGWRRWWRELAEAGQAKIDRTLSRSRPLG